MGGGGNNRRPPLLGFPGGGQFSLSKAASRRGVGKPGMTAKDALRQHVDETLSKSTTGSGLKLAHDTEIEDSWAELPITAINFYDKNPRKANNAAYSDLKESIRELGLLQPLTVTRRPEEQNYTLYAGGNTRLMILRDLLDETGDDRFRKVKVIVKRWRGEAAMMVAHVAENTQRGDMTYWDKAEAMMTLRTMFEAEYAGGQSYTQRQFERDLKQRGLTVSSSTISTYRYAVESLSPLSNWLSGLAVRNIQPRLNNCARLANHFEIETTVFYEEIVTPCAMEHSLRLTAQDGSLDADEFAGLCENSLALRLKLERVEIGKMLAVLQSNANATIDDLNKHRRPPSGAARQDAPKKEPRSVTSNEPSLSDGADGASSATTQPPAPSVDRTPEAPAAPEEGGSRSVTASVQREETTTVAVGTAAASTPIRRLAEQLVVLAGIGSCYIDHADMPHGFYMGFDPAVSIDLMEEGGSNSESRQIAWWVLAMASGQFVPEVCNRLPAGNEWRELVLMPSEREDSLDGLAMALQHHIGGQGEYVPMSWLFQANNPVSELCLTIITQSRKLEKEGRSW